MNKTRQDDPMTAGPGLDDSLITSKPTNLDASLHKGGTHAQTTEKPLIDTSVITNLEQGATSVEP